MESLQDIFDRSATETEDYVKYFIYFPEDTSSIENLEQMCAEIQDLVQQLTGDYIWHKDRFGISITKSSIRDPAYTFLHGITRFGDCLNDEWLIVYILQQISKRYDDVVIAVNDNDGDFLLIEAAMELPSWLDPSNSDNRVYIFQGDLHIIPLPKTPAEILHIPSGKISRSRAVNIIRSNMVSTRAAQNVQEAAFFRLKGYPAKAADEKHHALCTIPRKLAYILLKHPQIIPSAVEAFYLRDPSSMRASARMEKFPPTDRVTTVVDMTKTSYAQLVSQKFHAPKSFTMPPRSNKRTYAAADLGMRITCAFEMLYADKRINRESPSQNVTVEEYDFANDKKWGAFRRKLLQREFFKGELEGSQRYRQLELVAKQQHLNQLQQEVKNVDEEADLEDMAEMITNSPLQHIPRKEIDLLLNEYSDDRVEKALEAAKCKVEDDDSWMDVDPNQLEELLKQYGSLNMDDMNPNMAKQEDGSGLDLEAMMKKFEDFVNYEQSGLEGAEFPMEETFQGSNNDENEEDKDRDEGFDDDDDDDDDDDEYESENDEISFDPNQFLDTLKDILGVTPEHISEASSTSNSLEKADTQEATLQEITDEEAQKIQQANPSEEMTLERAFEEMDAELQGHQKINASFQKSVRFQSEDGADLDEGSDYLEDEDAPVDIQLNLLKNMLDSFKSQEGLPGPIGTIMNRMGVVMPRDESNEDTPQSKK